MKVPTLPTFATFAKVIGTVTVSPVLPVAVPIVTPRPVPNGVIVNVNTGLFVTPKSKVSAFVPATRLLR